MCRRERRRHVHTFRADRNARPTLRIPSSLDVAYLDEYAHGTLDMSQLSFAYR